jgi:FtsZ-interacting cell division protein YlmF
VARFKTIFKKFLGFEEEQDEALGLNTSEAEEHESFYHPNREAEEVPKSLPVDSMHEQEKELGRPQEKWLYPKTYADACDIVEHLVAGYVVVANMEDVDIDTCKRITDFILGAIYVLDGDAEKLSRKSFRFWTTK